MTLPLGGSKTALFLNAISLPALRKKEGRDVFLRKSSNQSLFHMSMGRFVCVSVYFSVHSSFVSLNVLFNHPDHVLWLQVRLRLLSSP